MINGFVKFHRYLAEHPIFSQAELWQLFCYIVFHSQINRELKLIRNEKGLFRIHVEAGQFFVTRQSLSNYFGITPRVLDHRLKLLRELGLIDSQAKSFGLLIIVSNWCDFSGLFSKNSEVINTRSSMDIHLNRAEIRESNVIQNVSESECKVIPKELECNIDGQSEKRKEKEPKRKEYNIIQENKENTLCVHARKNDRSCFSFDRFWDMYGKKIDRKKCEIAFSRLFENDKKGIFATLDYYISKHADERFRKNPLTYLHGRCWEDEEVCLSSTFATDEEDFVAYCRAIVGLKVGTRDQILDEYDQMQKEGLNIDQMKQIIMKRYEGR